MSGEFRVKYAGRRHLQTTRMAAEIALRARELMADRITITVASVELYDAIKSAKKEGAEIMLEALRCFIKRNAGEIFMLAKIDDPDILEEAMRVFRSISGDK